MTLPYERRFAVTNARQFLRDLLDPKLTPRVPRSIRKRAGRLLKHYPNEFDMDDVQAAFGKVDDYTRLTDKPEGPAQ